MYNLFIFNAVFRIDLMIDIITMCEYDNTIHLQLQT